MVFLHTANTLAYFLKNISFGFKKIYCLGFLRKNVFYLGFRKKKIISCILRFYNMFVKIQRVLANISKNIKILFSKVYYSLFGVLDK